MTIDKATQTRIDASSAIEEQILSLECFFEAIGDVTAERPPAWLYIAEKLTRQLRDTFNANITPLVQGRTAPPTDCSASQVTAPPYTTDPQRVEALSAALDAYATQGDQR